MSGFVALYVHRVMSSQMFLEPLHGSFYIHKPQMVSVYAECSVLGGDHCVPIQIGRILSAVCASQVASLPAFHHQSILWLTKGG